MSQTWNLKKVVSKDDLEVIIGRFQDPVDIEKSKKLFMYAKEEAVNDDDTDQDNAENHTAPRKKKRRSNAKPKSFLTLEDMNSGQSERVQFKGTIVDTATEGGNTSKYALLQVVKKEGSAASDMTNVGDWYHFRKPDAMRPVMSLDDIDTQYEKQKRYQKEANKKYNKIISALSKLAPVVEGGEEFTAPDSFGAKAVKGGTRGGSAGTKSTGASGSGGLDDEEGGDELDIAFESLANEEFEKGASDDEEDAKLFQMVDQDREENDVDAVAIWEELDEGDSSDEDGDDSDEEGEEADRPSLKVDSLILAGSELKDHLAAAAKAQAPSAENQKKRRRDSTISASVAVAKKDEMEEEVEGSGGDDRSPKKGRVGAAESPSGTATTSSGTSSAAAKGGLTEDMVRQVMTRMGGRVASKVLLKELKKPMKKMGDAGRNRLTDILKVITVMEKDPVMGTVFVLKEK